MSANSLPDYKHRALESHRAQLIEEYEAVNAQLSRALSDVERLRLRRTVDDLEHQISEIDVQLAGSATLLESVQGAGKTDQIALPEAGREEATDQENQIQTPIDKLLGARLCLYYAAVFVLAVLGFVSDIGTVLNLTLCTQQWLFAVLAFVGGMVILGFSFLPHLKGYYQHWDRAVTAGLCIIVTVMLAILASSSCKTPPVERIRAKDGMMMLYVPGNTYQMGSTDAEKQSALAQCQQLYTDDICHTALFEDETPIHTVTLSDFWIDQTEVSNAQYALCVVAGVCGESLYADNINYNPSDYPVVGVTWRDAMTYCTWVGGRLPTEAEWEYAARGNDRFIYPWGNEFDASKANFCDKNCQGESRTETADDGYGMTSPVTGFPLGKSWCGVLNMAGNVSEWVEDWYSGYLVKPQSNPTGPDTGTYKVLRGGSWSNDPIGIRAANRMNPLPDERSGFIGFRCVVEVKSSTD